MNRVLLSLGTGVGEGSIEHPGPDRLRQFVWLMLALYLAPVIALVLVLGVVGVILSAIYRWIHELAQASQRVSTLRETTL